MSERDSSADSQYLGDNGVNIRVSYKPHVNCLDQESPELEKIIRSEVLVPPPHNDQPYNSDLLPDLNKESFSELNHIHVSTIQISVKTIDMNMFRMLCWTSLCSRVR